MLKRIQRKLSKTLLMQKKKNRSRAAKGRVPVYVGRELSGNTHRFELEVNLLNHPLLRELLELSEEEFGYSGDGVLRLACSLELFQKVMDVIRNKDLSSLQTSLAFLCSSLCVSHENRQCQCYDFTR